MNIEKILKKNGFRVTKERKDIFNYLEEIHIFSANDLVDFFPKIGRASIFRTINLFLKLGIIRRINLGENYESYELIFEQHHHEHMKCSECDTVLHFDSKNICAAIFKTAKNMGFNIQEHQISVLGTCNNCK